MKSTIQCFCFILTIFIINPDVWAQPCASAGKDSTVCGYTIQLRGEPSGGTWTYLCQDTSHKVIMIDLFSGAILVNVNKCGSVKFIYSVGAPCVSEDTVQINFENRSFKLEEVDQTLGLAYDQIQYHQSPLDSCGNRRYTDAKSVPNPLWTFNFEGRCESFNVKVDVINPRACTADTILYGLNTRRDTLKFQWTTPQSSFINIVNGNLGQNRFFEYFNILRNDLINDLDSICPLNKCFNKSLACLDTVVYDTIFAKVPVRFGGNWHIITGVDTIRMFSNTIFNLKGKKYILNPIKGSKYYGPDSLSFDLFELDSNNQNIPINGFVTVPIIWKEEWAVQTIRTLLPREINDEKCKCNGLTLDLGPLNIPSFPKQVFPPILLKFSERINIKIIGNDYFCKGEILKLSADQNYKSYQWSNLDLSKETFIIIPGKYKLTAIDSNGCTGIDSINVKEIPKPKLAIESNTTILCNGDCATLTIKGDSIVTGVWNNFDTTKTIKVCPPNDQIYYAQGINQFGCVSTGQINITVKPKPTPNAGEDKELTCATNSAILRPLRIDAGAGRYFFWSGPGINAFNKDTTNPIVNVSGYYVLHTIDSISACSGTDTVFVSENRTAPKASAGPDMTINCKFTSVKLLGDSSQTSSGFSVKWSGPDINANNQNTNNPSVTKPGTYLIQITNLNNSCSATDTVLVKLDVTKPKSDAGLDKLIFCDSTGRTIGGMTTSSGSKFSYEWTGPNVDTTKNKLANYFAKNGGQYTLIVFNNENFCSDTDRVIITIPTQFPTAIANKSGDLGCRIDTISILGSSSSGRDLIYNWDNINIKNSDRNKKDIKIGNAGIYILTVRDTMTHCTSKDTIIVKYTGPIPNASAGADKNITCDNTQVVLDGSINHPDSLTFFIWQGPDINFSNAVLKKPVVSKPGIYLLYVTDTSNQCQFVDTVIVRKNLIKPTVDLGPDRTLDCREDSFDIIARVMNLNPNYYFQWQGPGIPIGMERMVRQTLTIPGVYTFFVNTQNPECFASDTIIIKKDSSVIDLPVIDSFKLTCVDTLVSINLSSFNNVDSIIWFKDNIRIATPNNGKVIKLNKAGVYIYKSFQKNGCLGTGQLKILPYTPFKYSIMITPSCPKFSNGTIRLNAFDGNGPYKYSVSRSTPDTTRLYRNYSGDHIVRITDALGCEVSEIISVPTYPDFPLVKDSFAFTFCDEITLFGKQAILSNPSTPVNYIWDGTKRTTNITVNQTGIYSLKIVDQNKCDSATTLYYVTKQGQKFEDVFEIPNVFTPNGDNSNDVFKPTISDDAELQNYNLVIYNRWGQLVFETKDETKGWNGEFKNELVGTDTYIYIVSGNITVCGEKQAFKLKGDVTLLR